MSNNFMFVKENRGAKKSRSEERIASSAKNQTFNVLCARRFSLFGSTTNVTNYKSQAPSF